MEVLDIPGTQNDRHLWPVWRDREFWIEVTKPDFIDQIPGGGG